MKLYTDLLTSSDVHAALNDAQYGYPYHVASDIHFVKFEAAKARKRARCFEVQLGTFDSTTGPTKSRHYKNSGQYGADTIYAATYDEWGWFIAAIFAGDPDAVFGPYKGQVDFNAQTRYAYVLPVAVS